MMIMSQSLKIGLVGYGKMGKAIDTVARKQGLEITRILTSKENKSGEGIRSIKKGEVDVLLDFTVPDAVLLNIEAASESGITLVVGTTGWYEQIERAKNIVEQNRSGLFYASNFSIGMNVMFQLVQQAVRLTNGFSEYDVYVHEFHHNQKKDSPSGSAYTLSQIILDESARKKTVETSRLTGQIDPSILHVSSTRAGSIIGTHIVGFDSDYDSIEIRHSAKNRIGFVQGALRAAQWMHGKTGIYTMEDLLRV